jgi:hypothetical protein
MTVWEFVMTVKRVAMTALIKPLRMSAHFQVLAFNFQLIHLFSINSIWSEEKPLIKKREVITHENPHRVVRYRKEVHLYLSPKTEEKPLIKKREICHENPKNSG